MYLLNSRPIYYMTCCLGWHSLCTSPDFNAVLDAALDSSNPNRGSSADLNGWVSVAGLVEIWQWKHPMERCFSHISMAHGSSVRIDLAFEKKMWRALTTWQGGCWTIILSLLLYCFQLGQGGEDGIFPPVGCSMSKHEQVAAQLEETIKMYWTTNIDASESPVVWDSFKVVSRGKCISAIKTARRTEN